MADLYFEDLDIGMEAKAGPYLLTKDEIVDFAKRYDPRPFHIDEQAAERSVFRGLTASGAHTLSIAFLLSNGLVPRLPILAGLGCDEVRWPGPARPGDELRFVATVREKHESKSRPDRGVVRRFCRLANAEDKAVLEYYSIILVPRRPAQ